MPVTLAKTWSAIRLNATALWEDSANQRKTFLLAFKNALVASGHWTVQYSSDATVRPDFAGDSWTDIGDLVCAVPGSNHSWIVLRNTAIGATFDLCMDLQVASERRFGLYACTAGYTATGTRTARPGVAGTEITIASSAYDALFAGGNLFDGVLYTSSDGACTRLLFFGDALTSHTVWLFDRLDNAPSWLTVPWVACVPTSVLAAYDKPPSYDLSWCSLAGTTLLVSSLGATTINITAASPGGADQWGKANFEGATTYNEDHYLIPVSLVSRTAAVPGFLGTLADVYCTSLAMACAYYTGSSNNQALCFRSLYYLPAVIGGTARPLGLALMGAWALGTDGAFH
jgi:hypothetical protein